MADRVARSYRHWVALFERHAGTRWFPRTVTWKDQEGNWRTAPAEETEFIPEKGIMTYYFDSYRPGVFLLGKVVGDGAFWRKRIHELALQYGCDTIEAHTYRNPDTWARKYNGKIKGYIMNVLVEGFDEDVTL